MNLTLGNTVPRFRRRLGLRAIALAGGLAIAASTAIGLGLFEGGTEREAVVAQQPPVSQPAPSPAGRVTVTPAYTSVYYLAGSEAEAAALRQAISATAAELAHNTTGPDASVRSVWVVEDQAQADSVMAMLSVAAPELMQAGISMQVVDLR